MRSLQTGQEGYVPANYVIPLQPQPAESATVTIQRTLTIAYAIWSYHGNFEGALSIHKDDEFEFLERFTIFISYLNTTVHISRILMALLSRSFNI